MSIKGATRLLFILFKDIGLVNGEKALNDIKASTRLFEEFYRNFQKHSKNIGLKDSLKKEALLKTLFFSKEYLSANEIAQRIYLAYHIKISLPSVYKMLYTLESIHIVTVFFNYPQKIKKYKLTLMLHYDHLICTKCGTVIQFHSEEIEQKQIELSAKHHFNSTGHTMVLYGVCKVCQNA